VTDRPVDPTQLEAWSRRLAASDATAMQELFAATHDELRRYADSLVRDDATARDVVQEAYIRIWARRLEVDPERSVRALLYRTVRNLALNHLRDASNRSTLLAEHGSLPAWRDPGPEATASANDLAETLRRWIDELPERQREALALSRFQGLSHEEIAAVMGIAPRTVNNHLVRALQTLRSRLDAGECALEVQ
jgi:RNA polymerase sigma-70 factor, ECF subfamily